MKNLIIIVLCFFLVNCSSDEETNSNKVLCLTCSQPLSFGGVTSTSFCEGAQLSDGKTMTKEMIQNKSNSYVIMADGTECVCCTAD